jgi:O-antigen/teichoic acid export membrane protein
MFRNRTVQNAKWIIGCKAVQALLQLVVGMLSARYLGPSNYGLINYAASVVAFLVPVMQLGLYATLVQEYVATPEREGEIMGTALVLNFLSGAACIVGVTAFSMVSGSGNPVTVAVCALYSTQLLFQAMEMLQCWFQAKLLSKYSSMAMLGAYVAVSAYKIWLLATGKSVYWFALSHSVEYGMAGIGMLVLYRKVGQQKLRFSFRTGRELVSRSKYYIPANMMVTVFQSTSYVMLKLMMGDADNGFYAAAVTCTGLPAFVYTAIVDSARPTILESRKQSVAAFEKNVSRLYAIVIWLSVVQSIGFTLLAKPIVWILYGDAYLNAVPVLRIQVWNIAFSYMGAVRNIWILGEGKYPLLWRINLTGAVTNVVLNAVLIPLWGACGAAVAAVLTQFVTNFVLGFLMGGIRRNNRLILRGMNPRILLELAETSRSK